jgi:hypothetical protein
VSAAPVAPALPEVFRCDRLRATLTHSACLRLWRSAQADRPEPHETRHACLTCPIGAAKGGQTPAQAAARRAQEALRRLCPGCSRPAARLINGRHCVSCYNRRREVARGRNCKGNLPVVVMARLHTVTLAVGVGTAEAVAQHFDAVVGATEAMILAAKRAAAAGNPGTIHFGRPLGPVLLPQPVRERGAAA